MSKMPDHLCYLCTLRLGSERSDRRYRCCDPCLYRTNDTDADGVALFLRAASLSFQTNGAVLVWRFEDAPWELRELSSNGGDEDWLAWVPPGYPHDVYWAQSSYFDSGHDPQEISLESGAKVIIGSHA